MMQDSIAEKVLVSVQCLVYNHAPYLRQCLDGFVMQKTSFKYEVIVHDDASTDGSSDIIREYAQKYPGLFKIIIQTENIYSKGISPTRKYILPLCTGKYIAMCEGDDYWTDPYKLQKQVDFLESHPEFGACCTRYRYFYQNRNEFSEEDHYGDIFADGQDGLEMNHENYFEIGKLPQVLTMMYRTNLIPEDAYYYKLKNGQDDAWFYCMTLYGKIWVMNEVTGVYRKHDYSLTWNVNQGGAIAQAKMLHDIWMDCWQYDKSNVLRETVLWSIQQLCTSLIRYSNPLNKEQIKQCLQEWNGIANKREKSSFYKKIAKAFIVRMVKRPYKKK